MIQHDPLQKWLRQSLVSEGCSLQSFKRTLLRQQATFHQAAWSQTFTAAGCSVEHRLAIETAEVGKCSLQTTARDPTISKTTHWCQACTYPNADIKEISGAGWHCPCQDKCLKGPLVCTSGNPWGKQLMTFYTPLLPDSPGVFQEGNMSPTSSWVGAKRKAFKHFSQIPNPTQLPSSLTATEWVWIQQGREKAHHNQFLVNSAPLESNQK